MKKKFRRSFSIIEVLIAIFILEIGILGIAGFYASSLRTARVARSETIASNLAAGLLDEELANTYDNLDPIDGDEVRYSDVLGNPFYNWYKEIDVFWIDAELNQSLTDQNMKKIIVTISWTEGTSKKIFQTASIKARH